MARYQERYAAFWPTLAADRLSWEGLKVDHKTLKRWLLVKGLRKLQRRRQKHRTTARAQSLLWGGQMNGSHHDWLKGRRERAVLMVMIDEATDRRYAHRRRNDSGM